MFCLVFASLLLFLFGSLFQSYFKHIFFFHCVVVHHVICTCYLSNLLLQHFDLFSTLFFHCRLCAVGEQTKQNPNSMEEFMKRTFNRKITITIIFSDILWTEQNRRTGKERIGIFFSFSVENTSSLLFLFHWVYQRPLSVVVFLPCLSLGSLDFNDINNSSMEETDFHWFPYLKRKIKY